MTEYLNMWKNYKNFSGRTTVRGYWMATLFNFIISLSLGVIMGIIVLIIPSLKPSLNFLTYLYSAALFVPGLALCIRRLRDAGKEWYDLLWVAAPTIVGVKLKGMGGALLVLIGIVIHVILFCQPSVADNGVRTV
ncbi:MAG: DUF805 domain-containing protein [Clostridiales bacterium]|nr:DUF805 domain-containing protein [Clostridiales bacterium]